MKMIKKTMIFLLAGASVFPACKKTETTSQTTAQKVLGKWALVSEHSSETSQGRTINDIYIGMAGDYVDFRTDGKAYYYFDNAFDTTTYKVISDNLMKVEWDTSTIKTLTGTSFILHNKQSFSDVTTETTLTLKK